ncbi:MULTISPECIES: hypothetical protein [Halobacteriales]|uniref:Methyltransferase, FkbM family n=2 Tax=Halobacteriales TaxID=2235 RepID=A0A1I0R098_9EURY|nr:hypothetical protein [Natrinema salifodinae]SEW32875.1 hypothetical protein SAMN05216285_4162 [Natrinema salifodinae]
MTVATRLIELYRTGGRDELARGIGDWIAVNPPGHLAAQLTQTATLSVDGVSATIAVDSKEDLYRARGHGERDVMADLLAAIEADDVLWDIGANVGTYAVLAALTGATVSRRWASTSTRRPPTPES